MTQSNSAGSPTLIGFYGDDERHMAHRRHSTGGSEAVGATGVASGRITEAKPFKPYVWRSRERGWSND